jgi:disulfide bond formation protein DsbB
VTTLSEPRLRTLLAWVVIVLTAGPVGGAVWLGVVYGESPCILCWAQRTSMVLIGLVALFVLRYGPRPRYLGMVVLLGAWGVFMSLRHSALHLARDVGQGFAAPYFGVHTYAWAWFIHWAVLGVVGVLLLLLREEPAGQGPREPGRVGRFAIVCFLLVTAANALQAFVTTGPPPFIGQADPVRFSLNPRHWVWMNHEEIEGRISLRGSWTIPRPDPANITADPDPSHGPLANLPVLAVQGWERIGPALDGRLTDLALSSPSPRMRRGGQGERDSAASGGRGERDPAGRGGQGVRALAVTDDFRVYVLDSALSQVQHFVQLDHQFSVDLTPLAGAAFIGDTLAALSTNKSYVLLRPEANVDADREWRHFRETSSDITELRRSRFATVRARQMYVLSLAYDPAADELITVSVPSPRHRRLVVSRFDRGDMTLASEFLPRLGVNLVAGADRSLAEYVVTGAVVVDRMLYAVSAAYSTLLVVDLEARTVSAAYAVPGLDQPAGLAARGSKLLIAQADGRIAVIERP